MSHESLSGVQEGDELIKILFNGQGHDKEERIVRVTRVTGCFVWVGNHAYRVENGHPHGMNATGSLRAPREGELGALRKAARAREAAEDAARDERDRARVRDQMLVMEWIMTNIRRERDFSKAREAAEKLLRVTANSSVDPGDLLIDLLEGDRA